MVRIAVCDDDNAICSQIESIILEYSTKNNIENMIDIFYDGDALLNFMRNENTFDIILLDIELVTTTGIEVGNKIRGELDDHFSKIIFISSKQGYESELFDIQPLNFLRKPIDEAKLIKCIELAVKILDRENKTFSYQVGREIVKVDIKNVLYFESKRKQIKIVTHSGEDFFYGTLESIKEKLPQIFIEPHGSFLINFNNIERATKEIVFMKNGVQIPISQRYLKNFRSMLISFEREKFDARV